MSVKSKIVCVVRDSDCLGLGGGKKFSIESELREKKKLINKKEKKRKEQIVGTEFLGFFAFSRLTPPLIFLAPGSIPNTGHFPKQKKALEFFLNFSVCFLIVITTSHLPHHTTTTTTTTSTTTTTTTTTWLLKTWVGRLPPLQQRCTWGYILSFI